MTIKVGEIGKVINLITGYDMSSATTVSVVLTKPDGTTTTKTGSSVVVGTTTSGNLIANEYFEYTTEASDIDQAGTWGIYGIYEDGTPKKFLSTEADFIVLAADA